MPPAVAAEKDPVMDTAIEIAVGVVVTANVAMAQEAQGGLGVLKVNRANRVNKARGVLVDWKVRAARGDFWGHRDRKVFKGRLALGAFLARRGLQVLEDFRVPWDRKVSSVRQVPRAIPAP